MKYREVRRETAEKLGTDEYGPLPCMTCKADTARATLSTYGARCGACYAAYCRHPQEQLEVGDKAVGPRAWAHALKARELAGERLTVAHKAMWRSAIGDTPAAAVSQAEQDQREAAKERTARRVADYAASKGLRL